MEKVNIVQPKASTLHETLGMTDERVNYLFDRMQEYWSKVKKASTIIEMISIDCANINEFAFCCYRIGHDKVLFENPMLSIETENGEITNVKSVEGKNVWKPKEQ